MTTPECSKEAPIVQRNVENLPGYALVHKLAYFMGYLDVTYRQQVVDVDDDLSFLQR